MRKYLLLLLLTALAPLLLLSSCKDDSTDVTVSKPHITGGAEITTDTLKGNIKGTMVSGKTYYFAEDITINAGDTVLMENGVSLIALGTPGATESTPQITVNGVFISLGTKDKPNYISVPAANRGANNVYNSYWGGLQCGPDCSLLTLKWTHIEYCGGPAGPNNDPAVYAAGDPRFAIEFNNPSTTGVCIIEDCWFYGSKDDCIRINGGKISMMRNTFEATNEIGGESINIKGGTVGDIAYNMIIGSGTNGIKWSNSGSSSVQSNCAVYNNTMVNCGFRQAKTGRGGSSNVEKGAEGMFYNNMIVNSRYGFRIVNDADTVNLKYDNTYYYGNAQPLVDEFNATAGVAVTQAHDIHGNLPKENNPQFVNFDVDKYDFSTLTPPLSIVQMPTDMRFIGGYDFHLKSSSPAVGKGKTNFSPIHSVTLSGDFGPTITGPGKDIGAYQTDGTGNQH